MANIVAQQKNCYRNFNTLIPINCTCTENGGLFDFSLCCIGREQIRGGKLANTRTNREGGYEALTFKDKEGSTGHYLYD